MGANYTQIMALLLGTAGLTALGSHMKANKMNDYDESLNQNLTAQGAQPLQFKHRNFVFGDASDQMTAHKGLYEQALKAYQDKQTLDDYNTQAQKFGLGAFKSPEAAKDLIGPYGTKDAEFTVGGQYGPKALEGALALQNIFNPGPSGNGLPRQNFGSPSLPSMFTPDSTLDNPVLNAGASKSQLPTELDGLYYTPEMVKEAQQQATTRRGQDLTADTARRGQYLQEGRTRDQMVETQRHNKAQEANQARMAANAERRTKIYARTAGLHGMSAADQVYAAYKAGRVSSDEYKAWLLKSNGGPTDSTSVTTDAQGNVVSQTHTHRTKGGSGVSRPVSTGHTVDVGGGVQIRGF